MKTNPYCRTALAKQFSKPSAAGFSLLELLVIIIMISTLCAITSSGWVTFVNGQRLNAAQETVLQAMHNAQSRAKQSRILWQASFQDPDGVVQWAIHPASVTPTASFWNRLDANVQIDAETTLQQSSGIRKVRFDHKGEVNGQLGRLTLSGKNGGKAKRCVIVSTLLGKLRTGTDHETKQDGKSCY